ncbi:hypothetical protein KTD19_26430 [Burkholderia multivorans]|uniref:hypothetical protein n=1 Tax=Burkholderia multivorans TaxID=87883 RepID=UPI000AF58100|nr:hypothetical protein [Burkholderia multivorans]MBU9235922.1 hypothetical protein [Burkholderia multivorans]MBU9629371.1 hypothetical protein [Burkholderia multivorans]
MMTVLNSPQPVFHENNRPLVKRATNDNALLASCDRVHGYVAKGSAVAIAYGIAIGCVVVPMCCIP